MPNRSAIFAALAIFAEISAMRKLLFFSFLLISGLFTGQAQTFSGKVLDASTNEALAYVNIGILNQNVGTVSGPDGSFSIALDPKYDQQTLKISLIGYKSLSLKVSDFKRQFSDKPTLVLEKNLSELKEVTINKNLKSGNLGNQLRGKTVSAGFVNNVLGNEIGIVVKAKRHPVYLESFHAMIDFNHYHELKFRLNFYDLKNGLPENTLLTENIIVTSRLKKGELVVDLNDYNIVADGDFFVSIELIEGLGEGGLHFLADYDGPPIITRAVSQGKWNKQGPLSFGFWVTAKY